MYGSVLGADEKLADNLRAVPDVQTVVGLRYAASTYDGKALEILGIDPVDYPKLAPLDFNQGDPGKAYAALSGEGRNAIANTLTANAFALKVGSTITLPTAEGDQTYRIVGIADDLLHFKLNAFYISQANLAADFHKQEDVLIMIRLKSGADQDAALAAIKTAAQDYPQFTVRAVSEYKQTLIDATASAYWIFWGMAALILFPSALGLLNTLTINVMERTREIGIVRAVGGSRKQVRRIVTAEALLLGLFGASIGVVAGIAMSYGVISAIDSVAWNLSYSFPLIGILAAVILGIVLALLSSILPARNAAKLDIIRALQYE
jgi:putative ABC transport system permease protein